MTRFLEEFEKHLETSVMFLMFYIYTKLFNHICISLVKKAWYLNFLLCFSENERSFAAAEHSVRRQGQVETDHSAEGVQGVPALLQRPGRQ